MAFDLNALASKKAIAKVEFMGNTATLFYDPSMLTAENINNAKQSDQSFSEAFCTIVKDWDVKRGTRKVPLTQKGLESVPLPFLKACFVGVMQMTTPDEESRAEGNVSSGS